MGLNQLLFCLQIALMGVALRMAVRWGQGALTSLVVLMGVLANLFVLKQVSYWGWNGTASDPFAVGGILGLNLLQELHGREAARCAIRAGLGALLLFAAVAQVHVWYVPSDLDWAQGAYEALLNPAPRLLAASLASFWIVQQLDVRVFGWLRGAFGVRVALAGLLSQAVDTALFTVLGLWGLVGGLGELFAISLAVKWAAVLLAAPIVGWVRRAV